MQKPKTIRNKPYMTIKLTKVSDAYLEPSQTSMMLFFLTEIINGFFAKKLHRKY